MINASAQPWRDGWEENMRPPKDETVAEWCAREVYLSDSPIGARYQSGGFQDDILNDLQNPAVYESATVGHTGMGKSAILEAASCWIVSEAPGPTLVLGQTKETVKLWADTRLMRAFEKCAPVSKQLPTGKHRHDKRKTSVIFPSMAYHIGPANLTSTQEVSMRYTLGDEAWAWDHGIIGEFLKRHHDRWNRKNLLLAQGGTEDDDWHTHTKDGEGFDRGFVCPKCQTVQTFKWKSVYFESIKDELEEWDWPSIFETIRLECENPHCKKVWKDVPKDRQEVTSRGLWIPRGNPHVPGRVTRYIPAMANPRIQWRSLVQEWLQAETAWKKGDRVPRRQFIQKRLAQFWVEKPEVPQLLMDEADPYKAADYTDGQKWEREHFRFLTVDVQKDHFWLRCRAWSVDGTSRGIYEGRVTAWENIRLIQEKYDVPNQWVLIDSRYRPDEVAKWRNRFHLEDSRDEAEAAHKEGRKPKTIGVWQMLMGEDCDGYRLKIRRGPKRGRVMLRTYSEPVSAATQTGLRYDFWKFSNLRAKDTLAALLEDPDAGFGIESDHSPHYAKQMQSETKKLFGKNWRWVPIKDHYPNHLWDCEVMQIAAACAAKCLAGVHELD